MDPAFEARCLVRGAAAATLATQAEGQPGASLVTPAATAGLDVLLLLSTLSEHTRQLQRDGRCALLFAGEAPEANPQTTPRVTLTGVAERVPDGDRTVARTRFLVRHPYAELYADFGDFSFWRVRPTGANLVGGFARAHRLTASALLPDAAAVAAVASAEAEIIVHVNEDHADAVAAIATGLLGAPADAWRLVGVDPDGADLAAGERVRRLAFAAAVSDAGGVRDALIAAARQGRQALPR